MIDAVDVARATCPGAEVVHCLYPAWEPDEWTCNSNPSSISTSFTSHARATVLTRSKCVDVDVIADSFGIAGPEQIAWLRVAEPSECLEVTASSSLRVQIANELNVPRHADLDEVAARHDPVIWALSCELRARTRAPTIDKTALEQCVIQLYRRVLIQFFGGRDEARGNGALSSSRASFIFDWIEANLHSDFSIAELASTAALTTSHFIRSFRRTTGLSPYQYVRARRLERARQAIARGATTAGAASAAGFESLSQFRRAFKRQFGVAPGAMPRPGAKFWIIPGVQRL